MNQQQTRAGARLWASAALGQAEAGVHRALATLEAPTADGAPGRAWRPSAYTERAHPGGPERRFTLSLADEPGGGVLITSVGEAGGATRRVRARVYLASHALLAGLYASGFLRLEQPPAATVIVPYGAGIGDRPWVHIAAGRGVWFATRDVSINEGVPAVQMGPGPADGPAAVASPAVPAGSRAVRLLLSRGAELWIGPDRARVDVLQLRAVGVAVEGAVFRADDLPPLPEPDAAFFRSAAAANERNAALNEAAGRFFQDSDLTRKRDSLYSQEQFQRLQVYFKDAQRPPLMRGFVYVAGEVSLVEGEQLRIVDGALVTEGSVRLSTDAVLEIEHSAATRTLPGLVVMENGGLVITRGAKLRAHGLIYVNRAVEVGEGAFADVVGAVLANDPGLSFRAVASTVVIRYDPAVLGTPGLRLREGVPVVAWVAAWEEVP